MSLLMRVSIPSLGGTFVKSLDSSSIREPLASQHSKVNLLNTQVLIASWTTLLADSPFDPNKPNRVINKFFNELTGDLFSVIRRYSALAHSLTLSLSRIKDGFIIEPFLEEFKDTPVFREYLEFFKNQSASLLQYLLSFLNFGKKLYYEDQEFKRTAFRRWLDLEAGLGNYQNPEWVSNLRVIVDWIFRSWTTSGFFPKHGSGSVAERGVKGVNAKNIGFSASEKVWRTYIRPSGSLIADYSYSTTPDNSSVRGRLGSDTSRLMFVPKDWKTSRSICMEPIGYQWAQQGVRLWLESYIRESILSRHIVLEKQELNQYASEFGSKTGLVDTIDLSSASDSVPLALIRRIFPPKVLRHMLATRSARVLLPDGQTHTLCKFAPMGSSLCFPTQSILYSTIVMMVGLCQSLGRDWRSPGALDGVDLDQVYNYAFSKNYIKGTSKYQPFQTYGDDITCDYRLTSNVMASLSELGFQVNHDKSYVGSSSFRESCGKFYNDGVDVSPYFLKLDKLDPEIRATSLANLIDHANKAKDYGYVHLRKFLLNCILRWKIEGVRTNASGINPILFSSDVNDSFALRSDNPRNTHLRTRVFNPRMPSSKETNYLYQRDELHSLSLGPTIKRRLSEEFDNYRYQLWWRARYRGGGNADILASLAAVDTLKVGITWRWTAK